MEEQTLGGIELVYRLTSEDYKEALGARAKASASARRVRRLMVVSGVLLVLLVALKMFTGGDIPLPAVVAPTVFVLTLLGMPHLQARQFHRLSQGHGEYRATVADAGVTIAHQLASASLTWQAAPRYIETPGLFVLLSADKSASCLTILPKRGATAPAETDRLRALLERHLARG